MALTKVSYSMIKGAVANVLDYGADPTGAADSLPAINLALASGAKHIYFPQGTYKTSAVINRPNSIRMFGDGPSASVISAAHNGVIVDTSPAMLSGDSYNTLEDIGFTNAATYNSSIGIKFTNLNQPSVKRVRVSGGPIIGIQLVFVLNGEFEEISVTDCTDVGVYLFSTGYATGTNRNVFQCINSNYCAVGVKIDTTGGLSNQFNDVAIESTTSYPIDIVNGEQIVFNRLYLEGNAQSVQVRGGDTVTFRDCLNVSAIPFIRTTGFAGVNVYVERLKDLNAGGLGGDGTIMVLTQGQVRFPSTAQLSTNAYTLDDYREATWTPTDGSGAGLTFTLGTCKYTKIGRMVMAVFDITYPATANGSAAIIATLPFYSVGNWALNIGYTNASTLVRGTTVDGEKYCPLYKSDGTGPTNADLSGKRLTGTIVFETNE